MEKYFVPLTEAIELKEAGFSETCLANWNGEMHRPVLALGKSEKHDEFYGQICLAPMYEQAFAWFREKHNLYTSIRPDVSVNEVLGFEAHIVSWRFWPRKEVGYFHGYQEAQHETLRALIKMLKP